MILSLSAMGGIAPKVTPELLPNNLAQLANNVRVHNGGVAAITGPTYITQPTKVGTRKTIYRFGRNQPESIYWFVWDKPVSVARGTVAGDTEERTYYSGDGVPKKTSFPLATGSGTSYPVVSYSLGVPAPALGPFLDRIPGAGPEVGETRAYVYTNVSVWGEESAPSPPNLGYADKDGVLRLSSFSPVPTGSYNIVSRRVYRSVTSASGTNYYFLQELPASQSTFTDTVDIASVGEPLATLDWDEPPDDLAGLIALPSGALCGFSGKEVCFSVVGAPYAWPQKYRLTCDYNIVAVAPMGQGVIVLTDGYPYMINTGDPESAQMIRIDEEQSCVSAKSVVSFGGGVLYASPDGLVSVTAAGAKLITAEIFDNETWRALLPEYIHACKFDNRYYGFFSTGGFIVDTAGNFTTHDITATASFVDPVHDRMYVAIGQTIQRWGDGTAKTHTWKSKRYNLGKPITFNCAQIKANAFSNLTFKMYADGVLKFTKVVTSAEPFRLPTGFMSRLYEFEVTGTDHWTSAHVAQSVGELKNV